MANGKLNPQQEQELNGFVAQMEADGRTSEEISRVVRNYVAQNAGKTEELQTEDAAVVPEDGASSSEDISVESHNQRARAIKQAAFAFAPQVPEFLQEPLLTFVGTIGEIGTGAVKALEQAAYRRAQTLQAQGKIESDLVRTDEQLNAMTPEQRLEVFENWSLIGDQMHDAVEPLMQATEITEGSSGSISTEFARGNYAEAANLTANQTAGGLASLVPFLVPGGAVLGPALLGGSVVGSEFEEGLKRENATMDQIRTASYLKGANEFVWELVTAGIVGKAKKLAGGGASREAVRQYTQKAWQSILGDTFSEATSEGLTDTGNRVIDHFVFGDEWDGKAAAVGFIDNSIIGGIVGGKVSTYGQIASTSHGKDIAANILKTQEQKDADAEDMQTIEETMAVIEEKRNLDTEGSLIDQVVLQEAETKQEEAINNIKERQKKHKQTLDDMTAEELRKYADAKDKADQLEAEKAKLEKEEKDVPPAIDEKIEEHRATQAEQYAVVESWKEIQAERDAINKEIEEEIKLVEMEEKQASKSEKPNPVGTAKRRIKKKELEQKKKGLNDAVDSLRPTSAEAKTRKRQAKAPETKLSDVKPIRDKQKREAANTDLIATITDPNLPQTQKDIAWNKYFKINKALVATLARNAAGKARVSANKNVEDLIKTELVNQVNKKGELNNQVYQNAQKAVERLLQKEAQVVKRAPAEQGLKDELREIDQQVQDGLLDPEAAEIIKDDIRAEYNAIQPTVSGLEIAGEEGSIVAPDVEKAKTKQDETVDNERDNFNRAVTELGGIDKLVDNLQEHTDVLYALLPKQAKTGKAFGGILKDGNPPIEIWESYFDPKDRKGKDRVRQLKKYLNDRNEALNPDSENTTGTDIMDGAFDFLEGGKKADVKKFLPLIGMLKRAFPGVRVIISKGRMIEDFIAAGIDPAKADTVKGYTDGDVVVLNPDKLDFETPIHEFAHLWAQVTRMNRPELYQRGVELMKQTPYWNELIEKSKDKDSVYYGYSKKRLEEEGIATMLGKSGESFFEQQEDINQWNDLAKKIWDWIGQQLGIKKIENLTLDQFNKLAVTEIITGQRFIKPEDVVVVENSLLTNYLQVPVGSTRDYTPSSPPAAEIDTHGVFNGKKLENEALNTINRYWPELSSGGWIGYTTGTYGDAVAAHKVNPKLNARIEAKVKGLSKTFEAEGLTFTRDPKNPGFHIVKMKKPLSFLEEGKEQTAKQLQKQIEKNIKNALKSPKTGSDYKKSKISQKAREILKATQIDMNRRELTLPQLQALDAAVTTQIKEGKAFVKDIKEKQKAKREAVRERVNGIVDSSPTDAPSYKERDKWINKLKRISLSTLLAPASNNDFHGLLYRMLPKGKARLQTWKDIQNAIMKPLDKANVDHLAWSQKLRASWEANREKLSKPLTTKTGIEVELEEGTYDLTYGEAVKAYNYAKDPNLYRQMEAGGFDLDTMSRIVDYIHANPELRAYANGVAEVYAEVAPAINDKLNQHGRRTFTSPRIDIDSRSPEEVALLEKVYGRPIPAHAVYTPLTAEGADLDAEIDNLIKDGQYQMYSVMDGRLKERTRGGKVRITGANPDSEFESYLRGPVRTLAFMDFAQAASDFFGKDQLANMKLKYGDQWVDSMKDVLKRTVTGRNTPVRNTNAGKFIERMLQRQVGGIMFFNVRSALLQHLSVFNYMFEDIEAVRKGSVAPRAVKEAIANRMAEYLGDRGKGRTELLVDQLFGRQGRNLADILVEKGYKLTQWGDKNAISTGGARFMAGKYMKYVEGGMHEADALEEAYSDFIRVTEETQQSTRPERLGKEQTTPIGRYILAFANTPQQYNRKISRAIQDLKGLRGVKGPEAAKRKKQAIGEIMWYMAAQNAVFTSLQSLSFAAIGLDKGDDEDRAVNWANSLVNTLMRGAGIYGALAAAAKDAIIAVSRDKPVVESLVNVIPSVGTLARNVKTVAGQRPIYPNSELMSDVDSDAAKFIYQAAALASVSGFPGNKAMKIAEQVADVVYSDLNGVERAARAAGYERYQIGESASKSPLKSGVQKVVGRANKDGTIEVDPNLSPVEREKTILHEKKHLEEMEAGVLDYTDHSLTYHGVEYPRKDGKIKYEGEWLEEGSSEFPWEQVAEDAETPLKNTDDTKERDKVRKLKQDQKRYEERYGKTGFLEPSYQGLRVKFGAPALGELDPAEALKQTEAQQFIGDWESNPETRRRFQEQFPELLTDAELDKAQQRAILTGSGGFKEGEREGEQHYGRYVPEEGAIRLAEGVAPSLEVHERTHASGLDAYRGAHAADILGRIGIQDAFGNVSSETSDYVNNPQEVGAYLQQARADAGLKPGEKVTEKKAKEIIEKFGKDNLLLQGIKQNNKFKEFTRVLNEVAAADKPKKKKSLRDLYGQDRSAYA